MENKSIVFKVTAIIMLLAAIAAVVYYKNWQKQKEGQNSAFEENLTLKKQAAKNDSKEQKATLPRLVDLGAAKCTACKKMMPELKDLGEKYRGKLEIDFIDVNKHPEQKKIYGVKWIPMQIFYNSSGKELYRHQGFFPKEDIVAKWKELGIDLEK